MTISDRPAVELRDVFCLHRTPEGDAASLQGTTLAVAYGELLGVIGPSGAGKSTMLRLIAGLQPPSTGIVRVLGYDIGRLRGSVRARLRHESIGFLGQGSESTLAPELRLRAAVALPLALRGVPLGERGARAQTLLEQVGLGDRGDAFATELSGGERQRAALCAALVHRPELLLADEPTGELDPAGADAVRSLIASLARSQGVTTIIVSHDAATETFCDRCVRIRDGRVVEDRRKGDGALVLGRGGWVQLPPDLLQEAGIGNRVRVRVGESGEGLVLSAAPRAHAEPSTAAIPLPESEPEPEPELAAWSAASVTLRDLRRSRGSGTERLAVIAGMSASLGPGGLIAITGRSGAGKTTLLALLAGLERPNGGEVSIDQTNLGDLDDEQLAVLRRTRIGYLAQEPAPIGFLSAHENVALALRVRGLSPAAADGRARVALARVGLAERARQRVVRLSAGETQRVALARALASARGLLLLDEPTSRLDRTGAAAMAELLLQAAAEDHQTVICSTHDPEILARADYAIELGTRA